MRYFIGSLIIILSLSACNTYEKVLNSKDVVYKLGEANKYYDKGKFYEASRIYENIISVYRGTKEYEEIYYRLAYSFYKQGDYLNAAYQFKNFSDYFSKSERREEMEYMYGVSLYKDSKKYTLDQTETEKAIAALQSFVNVNTESKYRAQANLYIDSAYAKIEEKAAAAAQQYFHMDDYRSASFAFKTLIFDFPDSKQIDYYYYMLVRSLYKYADMSRENVQVARYTDAINQFELLEKYYPTSKYTAEASVFQKEALNKINLLNK